MTLADVREWLAKVAWKAAPIKILGGGSVIISADEGPALTFLPLNEGFVLVKEIQAKARKDPSMVAAGRWSAPEQTKRATGSNQPAALPPDQGQIDKHDRRSVTFRLQPRSCKTMRANPRRRLFPLGKMSLLRSPDFSIVSLPR